MRKLAIVLIAAVGIAICPTPSSADDIQNKCDEIIHENRLSAHSIFDPAPDGWAAGMCVRDLFIVTRIGDNLYLEAPAPAGTHWMTLESLVSWLRNPCAGSIKCINPIAWP